MKIILGSSSPRRKEVLQFFSIPFEVVPSHFDESTISFNGRVAPFVCELAEKKGEALLHQFQSQVIVTADTVVFFNGEILLKPKNAEEGFQMLKKLSGKTHEVVTGVAVRKGEHVYTKTETTQVTFNSLTDAQIKAYINTSHGSDKAGSYGIQELGSLLIKQIDGSFYNVVGLPINPLYELLSNVGIDLWGAISS